MLALVAAMMSFVLGLVFMQRVFPIPLHQRPVASLLFAAVIFFVVVMMLLIARTGG